jgi:hypothetical protein
MISCAPLHQLPANAYLSLSMPYAEDGTGIGPGGVDTPFRRGEIFSNGFKGKRKEKIAPECDTRDNYCDPSRASDPRNPCGTHADKKVASDPPQDYNLPDR